MFILGHLGIGSKLGYPWRDQLPRAALLFGTLLPDIIDKPLFYGLAAIRGREAAVQGLISGSRTFGHTLLFLIAIVACACLKKSRLLFALAVGVATHNLLDLVGDQIQLSFGWMVQGPGPSGVQAFLWPLLGWSFPLSTTSMVDHGLKILNPWILCGELAGLCILAWDYRRRLRLA